MNVGLHFHYSLSTQNKRFDTSLSILLFKEPICFNSLCFQIMKPLELIDQVHTSCNRHPTFDAVLKHMICVAKPKR